MNPQLLILFVIAGSIILIGAGVLEMLRRIEKAIREDFEAALARAVTHTEIAVTPEKEKIAQACRCGHPKSEHWAKGTTFEALLRGQGPCHGRVYPNGKQPTIPCDCEQFRPARGPWPGEVKV